MWGYNISIRKVIYSINCYCALKYKNRKLQMHMQTFKCMRCIREKHINVMDLVSPQRHLYQRFHPFITATNAFSPIPFSIFSNCEAYVRALYEHQNSQRQQWQHNIDHANALCIRWNQSYSGFLMIHMKCACMCTGYSYSVVVRCCVRVCLYGWALHLDVFVMV